MEGSVSYQHRKRVCHLMVPVPAHCTAGCNHHEQRQHSKRLAILNSRGDMGFSRPRLLHKLGPTAVLLVVAVAVLAVLFIASVIDQSPRTNSNDVVVLGTYNVWNIMFNPEVRLKRIAALIQASNAHAVGLQEVRKFPDGSTQVDALKDFLPAYEWSAFEPVTPFSDGGQEGTAIISRVPLTKVWSQDITFPGGPDKNKRVALAAILSLPNFGHLTFAVTHLSYDKRTQCHNAVSLYEFLRGSVSTHSVSNAQRLVIAGDLNAYQGDVGPLELFTAPSNKHHRCSAAFASVNVVPELRFKDAWGAGDGAGLTFSNMPQPGVVSRPDRLLYSSSTLQALDSVVLGDGTAYARDAYLGVLWARALRIAQNAPCGFDCGPHGKCVCGVCVAGEPKDCKVPCEMCQGADHKAGVLGASALVLVVLSYRLRLRFKARLALLAGLITCIFVAAHRVFREELRVLWAVMPEELNPSDHRFLVSRLGLPPD
eukprot:m.78189 g.78189  ORF g.78189 m.78189 type:complete len:483 (-) comp14574_c0_seq4:91-1539(-)